MTCEFHQFESRRKGSRCYHCNAKRPSQKLIDMATIAESIGWEPRQVRAVLVNAGLADKIGNKWYTTKARLLSIYPEMANLL